MTTPKAERDIAPLMQRAQVIIRQSSDAMELSRQACERADLLCASMGDTRRHRAGVDTTLRQWGECS